MPLNQVTCTGCGKVLKTRNPIAPGTRMRCPSCNTTFAAGGDEDDVEPRRPPPAKTRPAAAAPSRPARPQRDDSPDDDYEEEPRPAKGKKKPAKQGMDVTRLIVFGLLALAVLGVGGYFAYVQFFMEEDKPNTPPIVQNTRPVQKPRPPAQAATGALAQISGDATVFAHVKVAELWDTAAVKTLRSEMRQLLDEPLKQMEATLGFGIADIDTATLVYHGSPMALSDAADAPPFAILVALRKPYDAEKLKSVMDLGAARKEGTHEYYLGEKDKNLAVHFRSETLVVVGTPQGVADFLKAKTGGVGFLSHALGEAGKYQITIGGALPADAQEALRKAPIPDQMAFLRPLQNTRALAVSLDLKENVVVTIRADLGSEAHAVAAQSGLAENFQPLVKEAFGSLAALFGGGKKPDPQVQKLVAKVEQAVLNTKFSTSGPDVVATLNLDIDPKQVAGLVMPALQGLLNAGNTSLEASNIGQLCLAAHNYHNDHGAFPPYALCDANGKPLLSWRVALLPYVGERDLYDALKKDEPWDSAHNKKVLESMPMPKVLAPTDGRGDGKSTGYRVFYNPKPEAAGLTIFGTPKGNQPAVHGIRAITSKDGLDRTILIIPTEQVVPWTKPDEIPLDKPLPKFGAPNAKIVPVVFGNRTLRSMPTNIDEKVLRALITWDDATAVDLEKLGIK